MSKSGPSARQLWGWILGFEAWTLTVALWAWQIGLPFAEIVLGGIICGVTGGGFLACGIFTLQTGFMTRSNSLYRFRQRPITFILDSLMIVVIVTFSAAWPVGFARQELAKKVGGVEGAGK